MPYSLHLWVKRRAGASRAHEAPPRRGRQEHSQGLASGTWGHAQRHMYEGPNIHLHDPDLYEKDWVLMARMWYHIRLDPLPLCSPIGDTECCAFGSRQATAIPKQPQYLIALFSAVILFISY